jgi:prepilin-type N-terminal cleavage/methylation domain-containing protein
MGGVVKPASGRRSGWGFTLVELVVAMLIIVILVGVVLGLVLGLFGHARQAGLDTDIQTVQTAVNAYMLETIKAPTADGGLPLAGEYALIDFNAPFVRGGRTMTFYPDMLAKLPRHWDEGVWRVDSGAHVSISMPEEEY